MKKQLFVTNDIFPAQVGGPSNSIYFLAKNQNEYQIYSTLNGVDKNMMEKYKIKSNSINQIDGAQIIYQNTEKLTSIRHFIWFLNNISHYKAVHFTSFFSPLTIYGSIFCIFFNIPFTISPRGELLPPALANKRIKKIFAMPFLKYIYSKAICFFATSKEEYNISQKFNKNAEYVLGNAFDFSGKNPCNKKNKKKYITYLGRLHSIKNIEIILKAYSLLPFEHKKNYKLNIIGNGEKNYVKSIQKLAYDLGLKENIIFSGHLVGDQKAQNLQESLCGILVSKSENFGNVVLEFLGYGCIPITSINLPWNQLQKNGLGFSCDPDTKSVYDAMIKIILLSDYEYELISKKGNLYAHKNFSLNIIQDNFNMLLKKYVK